MLRNLLVLTLCFVLLLGFWPHTAFASSSGDDDNDDNDSQDESNQQNEQQTQPSQGSQRSQVTWKTFKDREGLFTVQYPSNWTPSTPAAEEVVGGPIEMIFFAPVIAADKIAQVEFIQYAQPSVFSTPQEVLESEINSIQNDPTTTKFEIERPVECQMYTLNGQPACSVIYEGSNSEGLSLAIMIVDALANDGTEFEVYYHASFDLFKHFLPTVENMIKSFKVMGTSSSAEDFSLGGTGNVNGSSVTNANTSAASRDTTTEPTGGPSNANPFT